LAAEAIAVGIHRFAYLLQMNDAKFLKTTVQFQFAIMAGYQLAEGDDAYFKSTTH
jgi:hypothetical protein